MPLLDVSELMDDPDFVRDFIVIRSTRTVENGRTIDVPGQFEAHGGVQPTSGSQLRLLPEAERTGTFITIYTEFRLQALTDGYAPDQVIYQNKVYRVRSVNDWREYGGGFVSAVCELTNMTPRSTP